MPRRPSLLAGLAQGRAQSVREAHRCDLLGEKLKTRLIELERELKQSRKRLVQLMAERERCLRVVAACDRVLEVEYPGARPPEVTPLVAWSRRFTKPQWLTAELAAFLAENAATRFPIRALVLGMEARLGFQFATPLERKEWTYNALQHVLRRLVKRGKVEVTIEGRGRTRAYLYSAKDPHGRTLAQVQAEIEAAGGTVVTVDCDEADFQ